MSDDKITVFLKPTCTTCRNLVALLEEQGVDFDRVDYFIEALDEPRLRGLLKKAGLRPRDVIRTKEAAYESLGLANPELSDEELLQALVEHPALLQRPIVERGDRAVLARPAENVRALF